MRESIQSLRSGLFMGGHPLRCRRLSLRCWLRRKRVQCRRLGGFVERAALPKVAVMMQVAVVGYLDRNVAQLAVGH